jgi:acetyl esterase/lipase
VHDGRGGASLVCLPPQGVDVRPTRLVYLHGGGWRRGSPDHYVCVGVSLARLGYRTILPSLRKAPEAGHPEMLDDALDGIRTALNRPRHDTFRVVVIGHSSGAQLGAFAALDATAHERRGVHTGSIAGLATIGGPLDLSLCTEGFVGRLVDGFVGPPGSESRSAADPMAVAARSPSVPVLCLHGGRDPVVPEACSRSFVDRINDAHPGKASLVIEDRLHHVDTMKIFLQRRHPSGQLLTDWLAAIDADR